eukprot:gene12012-15112_t
MSKSMSVSVIKTIPISLRAFGYSMTSSNETRCIALQKAVDAHGFEKVLARLNQVKINSDHVKKTEIDILHVLSKMPLPPDDDCDADPTPEPTVPVDDKRNDLFIECMKVMNDKLCKATISKDYEMINTIVASITNVIKSTL